MLFVILSYDDEVVLAIKLYLIQAGFKHKVLFNDKKDQLVEKNVFEILLRNTRTSVSEVL